jgi:hypothetical protein
LKTKLLKISRINYNRVKREYYLKKERLHYFVSAASVDATDKASPANMAVNMAACAKGGFLYVARSNRKKTERKKKYKINSYLFNVICKFPRRYLYNFIKAGGREVEQKYNTMFFQLSTARFLSNKILRAYYRHLSAKTLSRVGENLSAGIPSGHKQNANQGNKNEVVKS